MLFFLFIFQGKRDLATDQSRSIREYEKTKFLSTVISNKYKECHKLNTKLILIFKIAVNNFLSKWFEPRSISSSYSFIVRVRVVLRRTVVGD